MLPMHAVGSMCLAMPVSKKRCWIMSFSDIKRNDVREEDLLSAFRRRYTSVKRLSFRPPAPCTTDDMPHPTVLSDSVDARTIKHTEGRSLCIEIQFTGPQPIEGPACLMCELLQGSFVEAHPVQLERGRKRKVRVVATGAAAAAAAGPFAASGGLSPGYSNSVYTSTELSTTDAARRNATECSAFGSSGSGSFVLSTDNSSSASGARGLSLGLAQHLGDAGPVPAATATESTKRFRAETLHRRSSAGVTDAPGEASPVPFYLSGGGASSSMSMSTTTSSSSSSSSSSTSSSDFDDLLDDLRKEAAVGTSSTIDDEDMFTSALEGWSLTLEYPSGGFAVDNDDSPPPPSRLALSSTVSATAEECLPTCDDPANGSANAAATTSLDTDPIRSAPDLACLNANGKPTLQDEMIASLLEAPIADDALIGAAAAAAVASGGAHVSEDGLWCRAPKDTDGLSLPPEVSRRRFSPPRVLHPVHDSDSEVVSDERDGGADVGVDDRRRDEQFAAVAAAAAAWQQRMRSPFERCGEDGREAVTIPATSVTPTSGGWERPPTGDGMSVVWREEECDFHGCGSTASPSSKAAQWVPPPLSSSPALPSSSWPILPASVPLHRHREVTHACQLGFRGLGSVVAQGYDLRDLTVSAKFFVDPEAKVERATALLGGDASAASGDQATVAVPYPSIWEIWPEVHKMAHIRAVEVDLIVEVRSRRGDVICTGPVFKVTYRRPATKTRVAATAQ